MTEENKDTEETKEEKLSFKTADDLSSFLMDLQGQIGNMQETIDKLSPVEENNEEGKEDKEESTEEMTEEEINEIDQLLQSE